MADNTPTVDQELMRARDAQNTCVNTLMQAEVPWPMRVAIALNVAVLLISDAPIDASRGFVINRATHDFRRKLQQYLPR